MFDEAMQGVTPLGCRDRVIAAPPPTVRARPATLPPVKLQHHGYAGAAQFALRAPGVSLQEQATLLQGLATGRVHLWATLDLHGQTAPQAKASLARFLASSRALGHQAILIVHGKGLHSNEGGATLRELVHEQLQAEHSGYIHVAATASKAHGGDGATYLVFSGGRS